MYLKRLELQGYKTFANRTEFEFEKGITAIVGPNGSGKSNVADAVRWVMGEHRYTTLRARRSDDMIFAGGDGRARVGMAAVSLTLDNSTGWLPVDFSEVTVQRRTYQSGENQYLLNGSQVRRRDIIELLAAGGVSSNTYTIIGQDAVDASLSMRPEERRLIFEEAAGIAIHQAKRDQALSRLEDTRHNLLRVNDIIAEIEPRLQRLRKQAERAKEYQAASQRLEGLLETWYAYRWRKAQEELQAAHDDETSRHADLDAHAALLEDLARRIDGLRQRRAELRGELGGWHTQSGELHSHLEALQRELAVKQERQRLLGQRRHEIEQDIPPLLAGRDSRLHRIDELEQELERLSEQRRQRDAERETAHHELQEADLRRAQFQQDLATGRELGFEVATRLADVRNRIQQARERRRDLDRERREHEQAAREVKGQLDELAERTTALESDQKSIASRLTRLATQEQEKRETAEVSAEEQSGLAASLVELDRDLGKLQVRQEMLNKARTELGDYAQAVRTVLSQGKELPGIRTTLAELIQVPAHLEAAIGAALGGLLSAVVTETWNDARRALQFLEDADAGRAAFLPLDSLRPTASRDFPKLDGVLGLAADMVAVGDGLEPVLRALLGRTVVVRDLASGRAVQQSQPDLQAVTLRGELLGANGSVTGGSTASGSLLLAHERERRELPQQVAIAAAQRASVQEGLKKEESQYQRQQAELEALHAERGQLDKELRNKEEEVASLRASEQRATQELHWHDAAVARLTEEMETIQTRELSLLDEAETGKQREQEAGESMSRLQKELESLDATPLQERLADLRTAVAVLDRTQESQKAALSGHRSSLEQIESQLEEKRRRAEELAGEAGELDGAIASLTERVEALSNQADILSSQIADTERESVELEKKQGELERSEVTSRRRLQDQEVSYNKAVLQLQRCQDELHNLQERIEADLEAVAIPTDFARQLPLDIDARFRSLPVVAEVPPELETEIKHLSKRLRHLGPVDLETLDEYDEVSERHAFLVGQVQDLEEAANSLRKVVTELDRTMRGIFVETFEKIAVEFGSHFSRLFNGGSAQLLLTDPDNPLLSGVEIVAQPPGRRRRNVDALSGGERALTGVALTFSILKACATPFCFLDEVDARLDEVNVGRFGESLAQLAEHTQVVVITHNRLTLEKANSIYGITMGGDGASRVLSLRLEEAKARVPEAKAAGA